MKKICYDTDMKKSQTEKTTIYILDMQQYPQDYS